MADIGSEFGGKAGLIQSVEDGHVVLTPGEEAMVLRRQGFQDVTGRTTSEQDKIDAELGYRGLPAAVLPIPGPESVVRQ